MRFFNLSLRPRLVLVALSGLLTYPAIVLDSALGPDWYPPILSWWLIFHGLLFGALVMAPFVLRNDHRVLRVAALMLASVMIYYTAIEVPELVTNEVCAWDACSPPWKILPYASGWIVWQGLVCTAMYLGLRRDEAIQGLNIR